MTLFDSLYLDAFFIAAQIALGILAADLASGIFHWLEDTYGREEWPVIGPAVIEPNIRHHYSPLDFARASYLKRNRAVIALVMAGGAGLWAAGWLNVFTLTLLTVISQANEVHRWAHLPTAEVPGLVRRLQRTGLLQSPRHHWQHHRRPYKLHYCTITDWVNPALDRLQLFRGIEWVVASVFGVAPRVEPARP